MAIYVSSSSLRLTLEHELMEPSIEKLRSVVVRPSMLINFRSQTLTPSYSPAPKMVGWPAPMLIL